MIHTFNRQTLLLPLLCLLFSCNESKTIVSPPPGKAPQVEMESETGVYKVRVGTVLTFRPTVASDQPVSYEWLVNDAVEGTGSHFIFFADTEGTFYLTFRASNEYGTTTEELRVDVSRKAPPVISFAIPGDGLRISTNTEYTFEPDVLNGEEATYLWTLDGEQAGTGPSYTFISEALGDYTLKLFVENEDGEDEQTVILSVVEKQPMEVFFTTPGYFVTSTDRYVFTDHTVCLVPVVQHAANPVYSWKVDETPAGTDRVLAHRPGTPGSYTVSVTVSDHDLGRERQISRHITRGSSVSVTAAVEVICVSRAESDAYRPSTPASSAHSDRVYEFVPAPGQFNNESKSGFNGETTHDQAIAYAEKRLKENNYISLGGFGGYIVVGFDHSIANHGGFQGYDFAIDGNAFDGSSEPGIVWVMQDVNGDGMPNDTWYELRGSEYEEPATIFDYAVTYYRPRAAGMNVSWSDNRGNTGKVDYLGAYHSQDSYYPAWIQADSYTLRGSCLKARNWQQANGIWRNEAYGWGYADNFGRDRLGDDPNSGADPAAVYFQIANAVHPDGTPANLQYIDFIKVQTGVNAKSGWIGEVSTEVLSFKDVNL